MSTLTITIIQSELHWENRDANLSMFAKKISSVEEEMEIVVLPEMFSTGFSMNPEKLAETMPARSGTDGEGETVQWMKRVSAENNIILTGSIIIEDEGNYYNRLIWMLPNGQSGHYDKRHRFAFAGEDEKYTAGTKRLIASAKGWKINLQVCYDLRFPVWSRQSPPIEKDSGSEAEYDLLIYVANWPERRSIAWKTLLVARAIENQCYVVGVNRVGNDGNNIYHCGESMVVDPLGEVLYYKRDEEDIATIVLDKTHLQNIREKFPFWKDADRFLILNDHQE